MYAATRRLSDPFESALRPPPNETDGEREHRMQAEAEARRNHERIEDMLRHDRNERKKNRADVSVLLLGQSESGKSTTLKQFQLLHSPAAFHQERIAWRAVIYLNLVRSIRRILEALTPEIDEPEEVGAAPFMAASVIISAENRPPDAIVGTRVPNFETYRRRCEPLMELEERLSRLLSNPEDDEPSHLGPTPPSWGDGASTSTHAVHPNGHEQLGRQNGRPTIIIPQSATIPRPSSAASNRNPKEPKGKEVSVYNHHNWKKAFTLGGSAKSPKSAHTGEIEGWWEDPEDPVHVLHACAPTMLELWKDPTVRARLEEKRLRLEESSGFYLDEIPRITARKYIPTDADVLKARLKTMGVVEHTFNITQGSNRGVQWKIYDVGGSRNQRHAWAPYFEDVNAIIFLAPISAFDQVLAEDPKVNRLEDSLKLWRSVVSNKLLANVNIVLFLNKCDLLQRKLESGARLGLHMTSYADRSNDFESVSKYMRNKFGAVHHSYTPNKERELYIHFTAVTDTRRTSTIIATVRDIIIKGNLRNMRLV
ncbi:guanine nucleotide binding protein, alpha subunit [Flagelloscypha sp. PMI_526]|nr:guanine nucleotide binding protein, alpha subunit [Flagelloscypha sp. PMI_526]